MIEINKKNKGEKMGEIIIKHYGILTSYECSCGGQVEASEIGYACEFGSWVSEADAPVNPIYSQGVK